MTPSTPYLIRALFEWINDNHCTPHLLVNTKVRGVDVPKGYETDGKITLNIGLSATAKLIIDNSKISFTARFGGNPHDIYIPITAVMGIYARENGEGMLFETLDDHNPEDDVPPKAKSEDRPSLKIVK